jgi:hypothetical protein
VFAPLTPCPDTYIWQLLFTLPDGPHSCMLMTIKPTSHRTKRMKDPMITMPGRSWRCEISQSMTMMKNTASAETVISYAKYLDYELDLYF